MWKETNEQFEEHKTQTDSKNFQADPVMSIPRITDLDEGKEEGIFSKGKANRILNKFRSLSTSQEKGSVSPPSERSKSPERSSPTEPKVPFWKTNRSKSNQSLEEDKSDQLAEATRVKAVADSNRLLKFQRLLEEEIVDLSALRKLSWKGIPPSVRSITWKLLMGYLPVNKDRRQAAMERKQKEYIECIPKYFEVDESERTVDYKQIQMDVPRTNPHVLLFQNGVVQQCLARILYIWAVRHPASGYVQGINDLATPFFVVFLSAHLQMEMDEVCALPDLDEIATSDLRLIEADTYWCLTKLLDGIQDNYTFSQPGIQRMIHKLSELVHRIEVPLYEHLRQQQVYFLHFAFRWMNCLLIREFPLTLVSRIWDTYMSELETFGTFHIYVCAAFLACFSEQIRQLDFQGIVFLLNTPPTNDWKIENVEMILSQAYLWKTLFEDSPQHLKATEADPLIQH
eukprot:TRINITY_DN1548_c0_g1_i1.p1 TRINITY_DN1548_c0_g1~~TRINITY_DN1548_c0_g1_i1.p1  ORF type:complete len:456 (-),score=95.58 TRINITY_DN1548_c0_g1_i1:20-1387(-)